MPHWLSKMKKQDEGIAVMTYLVLLHSKMKTQDESVEAEIAVGTGPVSGSDSSDPVAAPLTKENLSDMKEEQKRFLQEQLGGDPGTERQDCHTR